MHIGIAREQDGHDVAQGRAAERGYDSHHRGQKRQRPFAALVEQSLASQPLLELLEGELQRAEPARLHLFGIELERAASFVEVDPAAHHDLHPVADFETKPRGRRTEHHDAYRAVRDP